MALPTFNGFSLQDANYITTDIEYRTWPKREISMQKIARRAGSKISNVDFAEKHINFSGFVIGSSVADLQSKIDALYVQAQQPSKLLQIETNRFFTATVASLAVNDPHYSQSFVPFQMEFVCADPFAYGTAFNANATITASTIVQSFNVTISGTYAAEPTISYITPVGGGLTTTSGVKIKNSSSGEFVLWQGSGGSTFVPYNDRISFDYLNYKVLLSNAQVTHTGIFSLLQPGVNTLEVTFMGNTPGGQLAFNYSPRYL